MMARWPQSVRGGLLRLLLSGVLFALLSGVSAQNAPGDRFIYAASHEPQEFSLYRPKDAVARPLIEQIFNGLLRFSDYDTSPPTIVTDLAESYSIDASGTVWTFALRQGVQFHHGFGELTSEDVKFTIDRHLDPAVASAERSVFEIVDRVEAPDAYTVQIILKEPSPGFEAVLAWQSGLIGSKRAFEELGEGISTNPVGTGPFYLDRVVARERVVLKRHEQYFGGTPALAEVEFRVVPEETVALAALVRGEVHAVPILSIAAYRLLHALGGQVAISEAPGAQAWYALVNTERLPTDDQRVRQAILLALDFDAMADAFDGMVAKNLGFLPPITVGWSDELGPAQPDLEEARRLMREAGHEDRPPLRIHTSTGQLYMPLAQIMAEQLRPLFDVTVHQVDRGARWEAMDAREWNLDIIAITRIESEQYVSMFFHSTGRFTHHGGTSPQLDALVEAARAELDPEARKLLYHELQNQVLDEVLMLNLGVALGVVALAPDVRGYGSDPYTGKVRLDTVYFDR